MLGAAQMPLNSGVMLDIEGEDDNRPWSIDRFYDYFQSAISNKLLKIETISVSAEEIENYGSEGQQSLL